MNDKKYINDRLKFRIFDKKTNAYLPQDNLVGLTCDGKLILLMLDASVYIIDTLDDFIIEFCTGLKGKHGSLIYESEKGQVMSNEIEKKYICISVKRSYYQKNGWWLWGNNKSGYIRESWKAGLYTEKDFDYDYTRFPVVKMCKDLAKFYHKKYDSVLVDKEDFVKFTDEKQLKKRN